MTEDRIIAVKLGLAVLGALLLSWTWLLERRGQSPRYKRTRDIALATLGGLSFAAWSNFGQFHFIGRYVHLWEHYHYYLGAKYAPELGYSWLYDCSTVADLADGLRASVEPRTIRDLHGTNDLISTAALVADPGSCTRRFSPERWHEFRTDVRFFRAWFSEGGWERVQRDHGFNATPVWAIGGRLLAQSLPIGDDPDSRVWLARAFGQTNLWVIALADPLLLIAMWGLVAWAFGWRTMCVALLWWGTNFPARFYWNGGAMLRFDWLLTLVAGICFLKRGWPLSAGFALTYSALLRVFPGLVIAALVLKLLVSMVGERRLAISVPDKRLAAGCLLALALLLPAGAWATGGFLASWSGFYHNSVKHLATPAPNNMGLEVVVNWEPSTRMKLLRSNDPTDPFLHWREVRRELRAERRPIYLGLLVAFVLLLGVAVRREPLWTVACLGCGLVVVAPYLACYYYGFLLAYGLLWERRRLGAILVCVLAAVTCAIHFGVRERDELYDYMSLAAVLTVVAVTAEAALLPEDPAPRSS